MFPFFHTYASDEYRNHTSCISEAERYEKTIYRGARKLDDSGTGHRQGGPQRIKKLTPQEAWNRTIEIAAEKAPQSLKSYMDQLAMLENVPRKEKQFRNFTVNSLRLKGPGGEKIKNEIWAFLAKVRDEEKKRREEEDNARKEKHQSQKSEEDKKPEPKAASVSEDDDNSSSISKSSTPELPSEKAVTKAMKKVLKKAPNKQLKFKAVRKQVQESLAFKADKKQWKKLCQRCVDSNPKKLVLDGKVVSLRK